MTEISSGRALPLITVEDDGTFKVHDEAISLLRRYDTSVVGVIAVCGLYRTGKCYLLNLLTSSTSGFDVGSTVNACTKGIWIWSEPKYDHIKDMYIFFLDTEGLGSTSRSTTHDSRIFALALLLSSFFIYNSRGVIDGQALEDLSLVANLTRIIQVKSGFSDSDESAFSQHFPSFMWVLRDFTLKLEDATGRTISSSQYFDNCLKPQPGLSESIMSKNQIRQLICSFFPERSCVTLVRPAEEEEVLRNLSAYPLELLRPEFQTQIQELIPTILSAVKAKQVLGRDINCTMLATLITAYTEALNTGGIPVITSAWERVVSTQCEDAKTAAMAVFVNQMIIELKGKTGKDFNGISEYLPIDEEALIACYDASKTTAKAAYWSKVPVDDKDSTMQTVMSALRAALRNTLSELIKENWRRSEELAADRIKERLNQNISKISEAVSDDGDSQRKSTEQIKCRLDEFTIALQEIVAMADDPSIGDAGKNVLNQFLSGKILEDLSLWAASVASAFRKTEIDLQLKLDAITRTVSELQGKATVKEAIVEQRLKGVLWAEGQLASRLVEEKDRFDADCRRKDGEAERYSTMISDLMKMHQATVQSMNLRHDELKSRLKEERDAVTAEERKLGEDTTTLQDEAGAVSLRQVEERRALEESVSKQQAHVEQLESQLRARQEENKKQLQQLEAKHRVELKAALKSLEIELETLRDQLVKEQEEDERVKGEESKGLDETVEKKVSAIQELEAIGIEYTNANINATAKPVTVLESSSESTVPAADEDSGLSLARREQGRVVVNKKKMPAKSTSFGMSFKSKDQHSSRDLDGDRDAKGKGCQQS